MSPGPESIGAGVDLKEEVLVETRKLAGKLDGWIQGVTKDRGWEAKLSGFIFEEGYIHPLVTIGANQYALGGKDFRGLYPRIYGEKVVRICWGGESGVEEYLPCPPDIFVQNGKIQLVRHVEDWPTITKGAMLIRSGPADIKTLNEIFYDIELYPLLIDGLERAAGLKK